MHATEKRPRRKSSSPFCTPAENSTAKRTRFPAVCTVSASSVVNALSDWLELEISRDGGVWEQTYEKGKPTSKLKQTGKTRKTGTKVTFHPGSSHLR